MDRIATGIMIALAALLLSGAFGTDVLAAEPVKPVIEVTKAEKQPCQCSGRVMSLLLVLQALRLNPTPLDPRKD